MKIGSLTVLNTREAQRIHKQLEEQYGYKGKLPYVFLRNNKDKIYIIHRDVENIPVEEIRVDSLGLYFCTAHNASKQSAREKKEELRLSVEGSQIVGPEATKNIIDINKEQAKRWFRGEDLEIDKEIYGFFIVKHEKDYLGCGKSREGKLLNYLPKTRRIIPEHTPNE